VREFELDAGGHDRRLAVSYPTTEDTAVEATATHTHIDEWADMPRPDRVFASLEPTFSAPGCTSDVAMTDAHPLVQSALPGRKYVIAWDIGSRQDYSVDIVLDVSEEIFDVACYLRLKGDYSQIQNAIQDLHTAFARSSFTAIENNSRGHRPSPLGPGYRSLRRSKAPATTPPETTSPKITARATAGE
jgi:hypothetical protein